ncbi:endonuclease/exonuclease/phosphatase family protein [Thalassotalea aquiviva]|uniref:endonuclease/exonuclease/phosphatase family protein n=1 Tax=Thalassotalea aquiviva TaxID=3242415 RepID=UPI00352A1C40
MISTEIIFTTFNLCNYIEPPNAYYDFENIYSEKQWQIKQRWIHNYLASHKPDVIAFQEVFSIDALKQQMNALGYTYFAVVDAPICEDDFIYSAPVVAIASRYPISNVVGLTANEKVKALLGLAADFELKRKILRATVTLPHIGDCDCYVLHFKSKRDLIEFVADQDKPKADNNLERAQCKVLGSWGASIQRGTEAASLMMDVVLRRHQSQNPVVVLGDFNTELNDGVLNHLTTDFGQSLSSKEFNQYTLYDSWNLFIDSDNNITNADRAPTHYYGNKGSVLDHILFSREFDTRYAKSTFEIIAYETYDQHLISPKFEQDGYSSDHGVVSVTVTLRR